jgi:hypothetical protein
MTWSTNASLPRQRQMEAFDAETSAENLKQRLDEFGSTLRHLKEQEPAGPCRERLEEAERLHHMVKASLEDYRRERAEQRANASAWERTRRDAQTRYRSLQQSTRPGAQNLADGIRKSWEGAANAFNRAYGLSKAFNRGFGRDQKQERRARKRRHQEHETC